MADTNTVSGVVAQYKSKERVDKVFYGKDVQKAIKQLSVGQKPMVPLDEIISFADDAINEYKTKPNRGGSNQDANDHEPLD